MLLSSPMSGIKEYKRIISLVPSQTELLYHLKLKDKIVGITKFCIHPFNETQPTIKIGGTKNINFETIKQLAPDLIIANKEENVKEQIEILAKDYDVWLTDVNNLGEAIQMINDIGILTSTQVTASELNKHISESFQHLKKYYSKKRKIKTAYFIWGKPYMVAAGGTFIDDMLSYCGLENVFKDQSRYPVLHLEELRKRNCELILLSTEPYPFAEKHVQELKAQLQEVNIKIVDGEMFSWYGNRLLKAANYFQDFQ